MTDGEVTYTRVETGVYRCSDGLVFLLDGEVPGQYGEPDEVVLVESVTRRSLERQQECAVGSDRPVVRRARKEVLTRGAPRGPATGAGAAPPEVLVCHVCGLEIERGQSYRMNVFGTRFSHRHCGG